MGARPHEASNLQVVHCEVNAAKGTMTAEEFIAMCREVAARHPSAVTNGRVLPAG